jgi:hypothetical protein
MLMLMLDFNNIEQLFPETFIVLTITVIVYKQCNANSVTGI